MYGSTRYSRSLLAVLLAALVSLTASPAFAQVWAESGDAGGLIPSAQTTFGAGPLLRITGTFLDVNDIDLYCIHIVNPGNFIAGVQCAGNLDANVWLFDGLGAGIAHQDICQGGETRVTGLFVPFAGTYFLAIGAEGRQAQSPSGGIWLTSQFSSTERAPDGPGAAGPLVAWGGAGAAPSSSSYTVNLTSVVYCDKPTLLPQETWGRVKVLYRD